MSSPRRNERLTSVYRREVSLFIEREFKLQNTLIAVTGVTLSDNLNELRIMVSVWPDEKENAVLKTLNDAKKEFRGYIGQKVRIKHVPEVSFELDETEKKRIQIESILKKIK